jgi:hypothetical protein
MNKNKKIAGGSQFIGSDGLTHYQRNKQMYLDKNSRRKKENVAYIRSIKERIGCVDCGIKDWRVIDFDHLPGYNKTVNIASATAMSWGRTRLDAEIAKCDTVCANCHRMRTFNRASII